MQKKQIILGILTGAIIIYGLSSLVVQKHLNDIQVDLDKEIELQTAVVKDIATTIGSGGVNEKIAAIIPTCPSDEANQYDLLLASLDKGLTKIELQGLNILFKRCGDKPASRRAGMSLLLDREVNILSVLVKQRARLSDSKIEDTDISEWNKLVEKEAEISGLFFELVNIQREIISTLVAGGDNRDSILSIQAKAQEINQRMASATGVAYEIRAKLIKP